ncbi:hypothetical protein GOODEAATRI_016101 [Goodea atripinnis]|uniref:Ig-like domain-containing protein n=1 Tax=Goodea atripinnis TaxID=208336 RepID=A0ABV0PEK6_9TELE
MEKWRLQCGAESCCVKAMSLLCWSVAAVTVQLETAAHLVKLLDSPVQPHIFLSLSTDGVSTARRQGSELPIGSDFSIICSIRPQYEGGSFQLIFSTSNSGQNHTLPAVNHSALFLFSDAGHAHQGTYRCVYHVCVFSHNFSSARCSVSLSQVNS